MLLLCCSVILVLACSFFIASSVESKNIINFIICFILSAFANIVLTFELLSLFSGISIINVLITNFLFALLGFGFWIAKKCPLSTFDIKAGIKKILTAAKLDKTIAALLIGFLFACIVSLVLIAIIPGVDIDSSTYRVVRALFWIDHGNLNHFYAAEARMIMFPINSEILYAWFMLFLKNDSLLFTFNFCSIWLFIGALAGILSHITASLRKKLWTILISLSIPFVILRYTGLETGVLIAALVLSSIYFYMEFLKKKKNSSCFLSALALALGVGTKTTVILLLPALFLWCIWYSVYCRKKEFYKPILRFTLYFTISFLLFAAYNYILNFLNFGNFISANNVADAHANTDGFLSTFPNLYRYIFDFLAFPEAPWSAALSSKILLLREGLLRFLNADIGFGATSAIFHNVPYSVSSASSSTGLFGPVLFIPLYIYTIYKSFKVRTKRSMLLLSFLLIFLFTMIIMSYKLAFMSFNIRFVATFVLLTVPLISYFYNKKYTIYKLLITLLALSYICILPVNVSLYPVNGLFNAFKQGATINTIRDITECSFFTPHLDIHNYNIRDVSCVVREDIKKINPKNKILYFAPAEDSLMPIKELMFKGYKIDIALATDIDKINLNDYNLIVIRDDTQVSATIFDTTKKLDKYGYTYEHGILCHYAGLDKALRQQEKMDKGQWNTTRCYFNNEFAQDYRLKGFMKKTYINSTEENQVLKRRIYKFYENINNPVFR